METLFVGIVPFCFSSDEQAASTNVAVAANSASRCVDVFCLFIVVLSLNPFDRFVLFQ